MNTDIISFEVAGEKIELRPETVINSLAHGNSKLTMQEALMFMHLCQYHKLNPWIGEAYPIKFGSDFQMIIGYETYKRRGEEHPEYRGRKSGIVVLRNNTVTKREGTCLYPGDTLIGGWCTVSRSRGAFEDESYAEVALAEYQKFNREGKPMANWNDKPATMIRKVAVSQAMRDAFPMQYQGMYTEYEMPHGQESKAPDAPDQQGVTDGAEPITQEERQALIKRAKQLFDGRKNEVIFELLQKHGLESSHALTKGVYRQIMAEMEERGEGVQPFPDDDFDEEMQGQIIDGETGEVMEEQYE